MNLKDDKILVTGGAGFLGKFVVEKLRGEGADEIFVPRSKDHDLSLLDNIEKLFSEFSPTLVIHLAAMVGGIGANMEHPGQFFYKNLMMGAQLMEVSRLKKVKKFVALGTICAYPKFAKIPFREEDLWNGYPEETNAPYGLAKKMMLVQSEAYRKEYGFNSIFLLPVNLYGPGDNFNPDSSHVIPAMIRKFYEAKINNQKEVVLWGDGSPTREFLYVGDCAEGIVLATKNFDRSEPVNLGSGEEISIKDLAQKISSKIGFDGNIVWDRSKPNGQPRRRLDTSKAEKYFGFKSKTDFDRGLDRTVDWYIDNHENVI
ncbi:MAG: GDP-L-fucose synthase [Candidatus Micrarchaeota archaeon]|nr:GDP-L-fucose synthase [Candidatus Micrarchaeota archaeon]